MSTLTIAHPHAPDEADAPVEGIIRVVAVHGLKQVTPRRAASIRITPWELRVATGESTDRRRRVSGTITPIAVTTSGHGCPNWLLLAELQIAVQIAAGEPVTVADAREIAETCHARRVRWSAVQAAQLALQGPVATEISGAASADVALDAAIDPARWAEYNRKWNALLMRGVLED